MVLSLTPAPFVRRAPLTPRWLDRVQVSRNKRKENREEERSVELTSGTPQQGICREIEHVVHGTYDESGQRRLRDEAKSRGQETDREQYQTT